MPHRFSRYNGGVKYLILLLISPILLLGACSTLTDGQVAAAAAETTEYLAQGDLDALAGSSGTPFLFETEILPAPVQLTYLWEGLAASGYDFGPQGDIRVLDPDDETWMRFSSSREVQIWFRRHAPVDAALAVVPTQGGRVVLVVDRDRRSTERIRGLKVEHE